MAFKKREDMVNALEKVGIKVEQTATYEEVCKLYESKVSEVTGVAPKPKGRSGTSVSTERESDNFTVAKWTKSVQKVLEQLEEYPKVRIMIPKFPGQKGDIFESVQINGAKFNIKRGHYVSVPSPVAEEIERFLGSVSEIDVEFNLQNNSDRADAVN